MRDAAAMQQVRAGRLPACECDGGACISYPPGFMLLTDEIYCMFAVSQACRGLRVQDHLAGKQYLGWKAIRDKLEELNTARKQLPPPPPVMVNPQRANGREPEADDRSGPSWCHCLCAVVICLSASLQTCLGHARAACSLHAIVSRPTVWLPHLSGTLTLQHAGILCPTLPASMEVSCQSNGSFNLLYISRLCLRNKINRSNNYTPTSFHK